ncbi:MAG: hypothetical protein ACRYGR_00190, partial [Janthinobacterium lividum]
MSGITFDLSGFDIAGCQQLVEQDLYNVVNKIGLDAHANIVRGCPVDTGRARQSITYTAPTTPYSGASIDSNLVYMPALENGHSQQAPLGFWRQGLEAAARPF